MKSHLNVCSDVRVERCGDRRYVTELVTVTFWVTMAECVANGCVTLRDTLGVEMAMVDDVLMSSRRRRKRVPPFPWRDVVLVVTPFLILGVLLMHRAMQRGDRRSQPGASEHHHSLGQPVDQKQEPDGDRDCGGPTSVPARSFRVTCA